ncbi:MAG: hypothetical protein LC620_08525, partial [Halobacteriales archaeon]|nr:hypothetical protein [Halobacteriales archaeon]
MTADDESGAMAVLEAILVALLVLTAILFVSNVQRPLVGAEAGGVDLGRLSAQTLDLLQRQNFTDVNGNVLSFEEWVNHPLDGDNATAATIEDYLRQVLPQG